MLRFLVFASFLAVTSVGIVVLMADPPAAPVKSNSVTMATGNPFGLPKDWGNPSSGGSPDLTKNYYVIADGSGSMGEKECSGGDPSGRIAPARIALVNFAAALPEDANLGLYVFDQLGSGERVSLGSGKDNRGQYRSVASRVRAGGGTPLGASLGVAYEALRLRSLKQNGYGEYHIVVVTDGDATDPKDMEKVITRISASPVVLETIGFCIAQGHALNQTGKTIYRNAMNPSELAKGLASVLAESETFSVGTFR